MLAGLDQQGWITLLAGFLLALITLFTSYEHVNLFTLTSIRLNQQVGVPLIAASLATLNWHPVVEYEIREIEFERRRIAHEQRMQQLWSESAQIEKETEQLRNENARLAELDARIAALWPSSSSSSTQTTPPASDSPT